MVLQTGPQPPSADAADGGRGWAGRGARAGRRVRAGRRWQPRPAARWIEASPAGEDVPRQPSDPGPPPSGGVDLSVVVPAYNEQQRLGACVDTICAYLRGNGYSWELIIVDDGSSDGTAAIAAGRALVEPRVRLIRLPSNGGKGYAVRAGVLASRGRDVLISDADLSTPIDELEHLRARRNGAIAAIGSRALPASRIEVRQSAIREALGRLGNRVIRTVAVPGLADTQCGFKLFNGCAARAVFAMAKLNGWAFDVEILHLCVRFGWPVVEVPVRWGHSPGSKLRPSAYLHVLTEIAHLRLAHRRARAPRIDTESS